MNFGSVVDVLANVRVAGEGRDLIAHPDVEADGLFDLWIADGRIVDIAPAGNLRRRGAVLDAEGSWVVPGLRDHHVHLVPWALAAERGSVAEASGAIEAARIAATAPVRGDGRRILVGMRDALWADAPSLALLDETTRDVPTYVVNSDLHSLWLNSAAHRREGIAPDAAGVLREQAAFDVGTRINDVADEVADAAVGRAARRAASRGLVGLSDLDIAWNVDAWRRRAERGWDLLRVAFGVYPEHLGQARAQELETGFALSANGLVTVGPLKVIADGSLGTRTAATTVGYSDRTGRGVMNIAPADLTELLIRAAGSGFATSVHAIGDETAAAALDAFATAGVPGRMEHAQLVSPADIPRFARLGVEASVQPQHAIDDRDLTDTLWADQTARAYPLRALRDAGATLLFGSDAPVSPLDPWTQIAAAVFRTDDERASWDPDQAIDVRTALAASAAGGSTDPHVILPGSVADLAIVAHDPLVATRAQLAAMPVHATLLGGRLTHLT